MYFLRDDEFDAKPVRRPAWRSAYAWLKASYVPTTDTIFDASRVNEFSLVGKISYLAKDAYPIDGENVVTGDVTCADGKTGNYWIPFELTVAAFFGLPCRPVLVTDESGSSSLRLPFTQILRNLIGGLNPVEETITGEAIIQPEREMRAAKVSEDVKRSEPLRLSFSQKRWTEKKIFLALVFVFKLLVIAPLKLVTIPFKIALNLVKLVTEVFFPLLTHLFAIAAYKLAQYIPRLLKWTAGYDEEFRTYNPNIVTIVFGFVASAILVSLTVVVGVVQYALLWASRIGLVFTSPAKAAAWAFKSGVQFLRNDNWEARTEVEKYNNKFQLVVSYFVGGMLATISFALSALMWMITLPLALSTVTTIFPSIINAINWVAQLPMVTSTLAWFTQWPVVTGSVALVNSLFGVVGGALTSVFGPGVAALATLIHVQVPTAVMLVGTTLGLIVTPVASMLSNGADWLSNRWAEWVEQAPIAATIAWLKSCVRRPTAKPANKKDGGVELTAYSKLNDQAVTSEDDCPKDRAETPTVYVYQPAPGEVLIISGGPLNLVLDKNAAESAAQNLLNGIKLKNEAAQALWARSNPAKLEQNGLLHQGVRRATNAELAATREAPVEPEGLYEEESKPALRLKTVSGNGVTAVYIPTKHRRN